MIGPEPARATPLLAAYRLAARLTAPYLAWRMGRADAASGRASGRWPERLGRTGAARPEGRLLWLHGASVGEGLSLLPLIERLSTADPALSFVVTTGTAAAAEVLATRLPPGSQHQFAPLDSAPVLRRFLAQWRPEALVLAESEIWPGWILELSARGLPIVLANAKLSPRSIARWSRRPKTAAALLSRLSLLLTRSDDDSAAFIALGARPEALVPTGDIKAAAAPPPAESGELARLTALLADRPLWAAISTHPGEEEPVLAAHAELLHSHPGALLILAPRHPERGDEVAALVEARHLPFARRGLGETPSPSDQVWLADTLGETGLWFRIAPVLFLGGSLTPIGGHNPWEPAALARPLLHGPQVAGAAAAYAALAEADAAQEITAASLAPTVAAFWANPAQAATMGAAARRVARAEAARAETGITALLALLHRPAA